MTFFIGHGRIFVLAIGWGIQQRNVGHPHRLCRLFCILDEVVDFDLRTSYIPPRPKPADGPTSPASSFTLELNLKIIGEPFWVVLGIVPFPNPPLAAVGAMLRLNREGSAARFLEMSFSKDFMSVLKVGLVVGSGVVSLGGCLGGCPLCWRG
jgi:hypothetical protein